MASRISFEPGDVIIESLQLVDLKGGKAPLTITEQCETIDIFESIKSPLITGVIDITDGLNIREDYPILAEKCKIILQFKNHPDLPSRTFDLLITEVNNISPDPNAKVSKYQLVLC